jgi:Concanavalin A-like lectin/glucanases superfamily/FG-GAP-like repeat/FG-GAP repeat
MKIAKLLFTILTLVTTVSIDGHSQNLNTNFFILSSSPGVGNGPHSVAAADVNGDGHVDLICANYYSDTLSVLTNDGHGGFVTASSPMVGSNPQVVTAADVNGDGYVDLICADYGGNALTVLTNDGHGGFSLASSPGTGINPFSVTAADVNGDGHVDLLSVNLGDNTLTVLTNDGHGGFVLACSPYVGPYPESVTATNVSVNGGVELICTVFSANSLLILTNNGSCIFGSNATLNVGNGPVQVIAADLNRNGKVDLICGNYLDSTLTVLTNNGSGGFGSNTTYKVGINPFSVTSADVNGDGFVDLISVNSSENTISVLTNDSYGGFVLACSPGTGNVPQSILAADVNGDGKPDLITANFGATTLTVLTNAIQFPLYQCTPPPSGIISWWPAEGNASDVVSGNNGVAQNITYTNGEVGKAFYLNGSNAFVALPASASLNVGTGNGFTFEAWINPANLDTHAVAEWNDGVGDIGTHLFISESQFPTLGVPPGCLYVNMVDTSGVDHVFSTGGGVVASNIYQHLALTYDKASGMAALYLNGNQVQSANLGSFTPQTSYNLYLGVRASGFAAGSYFTGTIDEPSLYNRALSQTEIQAVYNAGSGGKCNPYIPPPRAATATAEWASNSVVGVDIVDGGAGYTNTPNVRFIGGGGTGAQASVVVSNGMVVAIDITNPGSGYSNAPVVVIDPPFISNPVLGIASISVLNFTNLFIGTNYQLQMFQSPTWINHSTSFKATNDFYTTMVSGVVGSGDYRLAQIPVPVQATAFAQLVNGFVVNVMVVNHGSGYVTVPAVAILANVGSNATAVASISNGRVTSIAVTSAGIHYVNPIMVQIDPPSATALSPAVTSGVVINSSSLAPYDNYQIQFRPDFGNAWGNLSGGLFSPPATTNVQYIFLTNDIGFFRLQYVP